ncbi:hypothetical protein AGLY_014293, partial [Aphis glycines]
MHLLKILNNEIELYFSHNVYYKQFYSLITYYFNLINKKCFFSRKIYFCILNLKNSIIINLAYLEQIISNVKLCSFGKFGFMPETFQYCKELVSITLLEKIKVPILPIKNTLIELIKTSPLIILKIDSQVIATVAFFSRTLLSWIINFTSKSFFCIQYSTANLMTFDRFIQTVYIYDLISNEYEC